MMHRRTLLTGAAALACLPAATACAAETTSTERTTPDDTPSGWRALADLPWTTQEIYAAVLGGRIYTAGGLAHDGQGYVIHDGLAIYDPATNAWTEGPRLPQPRHHPMIVATDRVFALGGYRRGTTPNSDWTSMTDVWVLDGDVWRAVRPLPGPLAETVGLAHGNRIHLVTGRSPTGSSNAQWTDQGDVATHLVYLPAEDHWETARPAPAPRNSAAGAVMDGQLYVAGGRTVQGGGTGRLDRYDPTSDSWDTLAPIPPSPNGWQVGGGLAMAALDGRLIAFGGEWFEPRRPGGVFPETWIYDPATDTWSQGPTMLTPRHGLAAVTVANTIYAVAGGRQFSGADATATLEGFSL